MYNISDDFEKKNVKITDSESGTEWSSTVYTVYVPNFHWIILYSAHFITFLNYLPNP